MPALQVDVTTEETNTTTGAPLDLTNRGCRCVIGGSSNDWLKSSAGGIAYVGVFGNMFYAVRMADQMACCMAVAAFRMTAAWRYVPLVLLPGHQLCTTVLLPASLPFSVTAFCCLILPAFSLPLRCCPLAAACLCVPGPAG